MKLLFVGLATIDVQYTVGRFPKPNSKIKTSSPCIFVGGPSANAAVACAFLNGSAHLVTSIGKGEFAPVLETDFRENRLTVTDLTPGQTQSVIATVITEDNGDRTIFSPYAGDCDDHRDWKDFFDRHSFDLVMTDGFYPSVAVKIGQEARRRKIPVIFDGGSWKEYLPALLPWIDVAICSADFCPPGCLTTAQVKAVLDSYGIRRMAVTRGAGSVWYSDEGKEGHLSVEPVIARDTLGAGDFFHGAFCYFYARLSGGFAESLGKAALLASATCRTRGTRQWLKLLSPDDFY